MPVVAAFIALAACLARPVMAADGTLASALHVFEIRISQGRVGQAQRVVRVAEGERIELRWTADAPLVLHLHGYDLETRVTPGKPAVTAFRARLTGRFPVEIHGAGGPGRENAPLQTASPRHRALLHVEVYPR